MLYLDIFSFSISYISCIQKVLRNIVRVQDISFWHTKLCDYSGVLPVMDVTSVHYYKWQFWPFPVWIMVKCCWIHHFIIILSGLNIGMISQSQGKLKVKSVYNFLKYCWAKAFLWYYYTAEMFSLQVVGHLTTWRTVMKISSLFLCEAYTCICLNHLMYELYIISFSTVRSEVFVIIWCIIIFLRENRGD
jgi:hypothetical protein